jgi:hypothetical protein
LRRAKNVPVLRAFITPFLVATVAWGQVRPLVERIDAVLGHPLVVPVAGGDGREIARGVRIALDDGQTPGVSYFRLERSDGKTGGWIGWVGRYRATPARGVEPGGAGGVWYAVIDLPLEAVSQGIWFGSERFEINWLPDPERASLEAGGRRLWASPVPPEARDGAELAAALEAVSEDPFQAWRVRLVRDGIAPTGGADRTGAAGTDLASLRDDLSKDAGTRFLGELARHHEARWQLILGRLALIDAEAASRMRRRLGGVALIDGRWLPVWTPDSPELRALQVDLLSPWVDDQTRVLRALGWLDAQPKALAWVIDDAGDPGVDESRLFATLGLLSLPARDAPLLVEVGGALDAPTLETAEPRRAMTVQTGVPLVERRGAAVRTVSLPVRIGSESTTTDAVASIPAAMPPGVRLGPLLHGWTMPALLASDPAMDALPEFAATGVLRRTSQAGSGGDATGWSVFVECAAGGDGGEDSVTVWAGPYGVPRGVWRIERDGSVFRLFGFSDLARVSVVETPGGWALDAELPASAVDEDGVLRIGLVRERGVGGVGGAGGVERSSWPRRMTPGRDEPGRLPVDTRRWSGF